METKKKKPLKNANGQGSIIELSKNRNKPFAVRMTTGFVDGKQVYKYVGYYDSRKAAKKALEQEHLSPTSDNSNAAFKAVYEAWKAIHERNISKQTLDNYKAAYLLLKPLHEVKLNNIKTSDMQTIIFNLEKSKSTKTKIKSLCVQMYKYAMENDIVHKNYAEFIKIDKEDKTEKKIFTTEEINILFANDTTEWVDSILILIYTGLRIQELLNLMKCDIDLKKRTIIGGLKTDAGKNRIVPIHDKIYKYVKARCEAATDDMPLFHCEQRHYRDYIYYPLLERLKIDKKSPHSTRHTCATLLASAGASPLAIKQILGHSDYAFTVSQYTHTDEQFLITEMQKINS